MNESSLPADIEASVHEHVRCLMGERPGGAKKTGWVGDCCVVYHDRHHLPYFRGGISSCMWYYIGGIACPFVVVVVVVGLVLQRIFFFLVFGIIDTLFMADLSGGVRYIFSRNNYYFLEQIRVCSLLMEQCVCFSRVSSS